jgi:acetyl-CoA/propionyl-CoA carboxylase, biotin carboxylase, biotin carboxyl carrier protein
VADPAFAPTDGTAFRVHTRWIETEFAGGIEPWPGTAGEGAAPEPERERVVVEVGGKRLEVVLPGGLGGLGGAAATARQKAPKRRRSTAGGATGGGDALTSPMQGTIVKVAVSDGATVAAGDTVVVLEAMKMEQPITAHQAGTVTGLQAEVGQTVAAGATLCEITAT